MNIASTSLEINEFGCIDHMVLPAGWRTPPQGLEPTSTHQMRFYSPTNPDVTIDIIYPARPTFEEQQAAIKTLFDKPPHVLLPKEFSDLHGIVRGADEKERFRPLKVATELWNAQLSLVVTGRWLEEDVDCFWLLVDPTGTREKLAEVMYCAPKDEYLKFLSQAQASLKTIVWR